MAGRRGRPEQPIPAGLPGADLARYLRQLRQAVNVTYRQMAETVPCKQNTLSQIANGKGIPGWPRVETYLKALRSAAPDGVPPDAEHRARAFWEQARRVYPTDGRTALATVERPGRGGNTLLRLSGWIRRVAGRTLRGPGTRR